MSPGWSKHIKLVDTILLVLALAIAAGIAVQYIPEREPAPGVEVVDPLEVREARAQTEPLLDAASDAVEGGRLIEPVGENALHLYRQVIEIDPSHKEAEQHSRQIVQRYAEQIRQELDGGAIKEADRKAQLLFAAAPELSLVKQLLHEVRSAAGATLPEITRLLVQAQQDLIEDRLVSPRGNNALSRFRRVIEIEPENEPARRGIETILEHYVAQAKNRLANDDLESAASHIENIALVDPKYLGLPNLRSKLELLRQQQARVKVERDERQPPARPDIDVINEMVDKYRAAFEARDVIALHNMSEFQPDDEGFPQQFFSQYSEFRLEISGVEYIRGEHKGIARVTLFDLVEVGGDPVDWAAWRQFEIVIEKKPSGQWKVFWRWGKV